MQEISLKDLLEAGAHFGHQVNRWNPKMQPYIYGAREGVHIFDLAKTKEGLEKAAQFLKGVAGGGGLILWLGTKRQAQAVVKETAVKLGSPYIIQRWIGGLLTNFAQVRKSYDRMVELKSKKASGELARYTKKENILIDREVQRLEKFFGGLDALTKLPDVLVVVDTHREDSAIREANRVNVPVVGIIDSNANPDKVTHGIPANDDAVKSVELIVRYLGEAVAEGSLKSSSNPQTPQISPTPLKTPKTPKKTSPKKSKKPAKMKLPRRERNPSEAPMDIGAKGDRIE